MLKIQTQKNDSMSKASCLMYWGSLLSLLFCGVLMFICFECFSVATAAAWRSPPHLLSALMRVKVDVWRSHFHMFNFLPSSATLLHNTLHLYLHVSTNVTTRGMFSDAIASDHYLTALWLCSGCKTRLPANYSLSDGLALSLGASFWSKCTQTDTHHHAFCHYYTHRPP